MFHPKYMHFLVFNARLRLLPLSSSPRDHSSSFADILVVDLCDLYPLHIGQLQDEAVGLLEYLISGIVVSFTPRMKAQCGRYG